MAQSPPSRHADISAHPPNGDGPRHTLLAAPTTIPSATRQALGPNAGRWRQKSTDARTEGRTRRRNGLRRHSDGAEPSPTAQFLSRALPPHAGQSHPTHPTQVNHLEPRCHGGVSSGAWAARAARRAAARVWPRRCACRCAEQPWKTNAPCAAPPARGSVRSKGLHAVLREHRGRLQTVATYLTAGALAQAVAGR